MLLRSMTMLSRTRDSQKAILKKQFEATFGAAFSPGIIFFMSSAFSSFGIAYSH